MYAKSFLTRSIPGVKKTATLLSAIIKPTNGRRIRGTSRYIGQFQATLLDLNYTLLFYFGFFSPPFVLQTQPSCRKGGSQDFWELQWSRNCYGKTAANKNARAIIRFHLICHYSELLFYCYCRSQVDNSRLTISCFEPIVLVYDHHDTKWKSREVTAWVSPRTVPMPNIPHASMSI